MKKRVMIAVGCVSALVALTATADTEIVTVCQGVSEPVPVDLVHEAKVVSGAVTLTFATSWAESAPAGAEAVVEVDGETLVCTASEYGTYVWTPPCDGTFTLKHKVFAEGEQIGDTLTATIVADGIPGAAAVGPAPDDAELVCAAESAAVKIDLTPGTRTADWTESLFASPEWGGWAGVPSSGAYCVVELDGELVSNSAESVSFDWTPTAFGTYSFTHRVFSQGGTQIGETLAATFNVAAKDIALAQVSVDCSDVTYSGAAYTPAIQSAAFGERTLVEGTDYTLAYLGNVNAGTATITLTGINFFNGTYTTNFTIRPKALTSSMVGTVANVTYTGSAHKPEPMVVDSESGYTLVKGTDYTLSWGANTAAGSGSVTVTGKGNYTGTVIKHFSIDKATYDMSGARWTAGAFTYDGTEKSVVVEGLPSGVSVASYANNAKTAAGSYTATVTLNYDTTNFNAPAMPSCNWSIARKNIAGATVTLGPALVYNGSEQEQVVESVKIDGLTATYTVSGNKATNAGAYTLTVAGTGNFTGTATAQWRIWPDGIVQQVTSYDGIYDGEGHGIEVAVTKPAAAAVKYAYAANGPYAEDAILFTNVTEGAIAVWYTVEAENYTTVTNFGTVKISPKVLTDAMVTVADTAYVYDATAKTPTVTVTDGEPSILAESDYDVAYSDNINAGTDAAKVTVTGKGNYTGTVIKHFSIDKATYDMSGAKWDYPGAFAYDGTAKSVHVSSLPSGVTAAYTGNTAAAPGTYTAHAEFIYDATNYNKPEIADLVWVIQSAEETKLKETFDGLPAEIAPDGEGGWIVTVTNDIDSADLPIEIPDNVGYVTIDLGGHDLLGGDGRPAIAVVPGEGDGEPTQLTIANSGDDAIVQGGEGSPAIEVDDGAKDGVFVNIGEGVTVQGGDDFTPAIDGEVGTNEGTIVEPVRFHIPGEGAVTVPKTWKTGQKVTWKAKAEKGSVFARWEGAFVDSLNLSENERRDPSLAFIVPAGFDANLISAVFIPIDDDGLSELSFADGEGLPMGGEEGILFELKADVGEFWLVDDSRSYVSATVSGLPPGLKFNAKKMSVTGAPTRSGVYWVQVKAKNASGYQLAVNARMAVSGYTKETAEPKLAKAVYHPLTVVCATEGGTVAGTGVYAEGKKVSVSARPDRGRVFAGWYRDAALERPMSFAAGDWRAATQSVTVPEVRYLFAKFVTADADKGSIELGVNGAALPSAPAGTPALATNVWAGVALRWRLAADALSSPTVKVEGLPPGLKFTAKDIMKKGSKTEVDIPANTIYGAPTAASKIDAKTGAAKPYAVKVTVTTAGKSTQAYQIDAVVDPLPAWAAGTFGGECGEPGGEAPAGTATLTIAANGKISGKVLEGGRTWSLSAGELSRAEHVGEGLVFYATAIAKAGGDVATNLVAVAADDGIGVASGRDAYGHAGRVPPPWAASQNLWKRADTKAEAPVFKKSFDRAIELGEPGDENSTVKLTFKKDGVVSFTGKVDGTSVSGSSQLVWGGGSVGTALPGWQVTLYAPPKATAKPPFAGWCETFAVTLTTDDQGVVTDVGL